MTPFRAIGLALTSLAAGVPELAGGWCKFEDPVPTTREFKRAIRVSKSGLARSTVSDVAGGPRDWSTDYELELQAREATASLADAAADQLLAEVFAVLAAEGVGAAMNQGVLALVVEPGVTFSDVEQGDTSTASAVLVITVTHRTRGHELTPWPN